MQALTTANVNLVLDLVQDHCPAPLAHISMLIIVMHVLEICKAIASDLAETQATLLIVFLFWAHFVGFDATWIRQCLCPWQAEGALIVNEIARESLSQSLLRGEAPSPAASTWGAHVLPATASVSTSSPPSPPPPPSPPLELSSGVGGIPPRRMGGSPAVASGAACCGSILLVVLALLTPSAVTLIFLFFGAAGLLSIPSWPFAAKCAASPLST
jgi:hypothetical protein